MNEMFMEQMKIVSLSGGFIYLGIFIILVYVFYLKTHNYYTEIWYSLISFSSYTYAIALKYVFQDTRPLTAELPKLPVDIYSFPSTHVVSYTVIFGFFLYVLHKIKTKNTLTKISLKIIFLYFLVFVGLSRVLLGQHWIKDVVYGYFFGGIYLAILILFYKKLKYPVSKNKN